VRRYIYSATLHDPRSGVRTLLFDGVPDRQRRLARLMWPVTRRLMRAGMNTYPHLVPALEAEIDAELSRFEERLGAGDHLVDGRFGRADLTAASLLSPLARPEALPLYQRLQLPDQVEAVLRRWSKRPALRWVLRVYASDRHRSGLDASAPPRAA
jgi:glutathione S-transferase